MRSRVHLAWKLAVLALMCQGWAPVRAQAPDQPDRQARQDDERIIVTGQRLTGLAIGNPEPERELNPADIAVYGADSLRDLIDALSLETRGTSVGSGPTLVLLNGRRIWSFSEIGDIPPEAVLRIDILSEEVARRYGYPISSKVLNVVLKPSYATRVAELAYGQAMAGGRASPEGSFTIARNGAGLRWNLNVTAAHEDRLLESERRIRGGFGSLRSLQPEQDRLAVAGTVARDRPAGISYSANAKVEIRHTVDFTGPSAALIARARALRRVREDVSVRIGGSARGEMAGWQWTVAGDLQHGANATRGERAGSRGYRANVQRTEFNLDGLANRSIANLPAGEAGLSLRVAFSESALTSRSSLSPGPQIGLNRTRGTASAGLDLPLSSRAQGGRGVGDLTVGLSGEAVVDDLQRGLSRFEGSMNWSPVPPLTFGLGVSHEKDAPSLEDLGDSVIALENVPVFDFARGETAVVRLRTGGNPFLTIARRETVRAGVTLRPAKGLNLSATFTRSRAIDLVGPFPAITREVEQAFPDRFVRDAEGRLIELDQSPVNASREARDQVRWGFNWDLPIGGQTPARTEPTASAREAAAALDRSGRLNLSIFHTVRLRDDLLIREGLPVLDFLKGSVVGIGGGRARNLIEAQVSVGRAGLGARISGSMESGSKTTVTSGETLSFSPVARIDLRLFADLGQLMPRRRWAAGTRVSLQVGNLLDSRVRVRSSVGAVPDGLQGAYLDPLGRTMKVSLRRVF